VRKINTITPNNGVGWRTRLHGEEASFYLGITVVSIFSKKNRTIWVFMRLFYEEDVCRREV
jgi:hypothetical protein